MYILGILITVSRNYTVVSNRETGKGRSDCLIKPFDKNKFAVIIEFKHLKKEGFDLKEEALKGLAQIEEKSYIHTLKEEGYDHVYKYSIAFYKKNCYVANG